MALFDNIERGEIEDIVKRKLKGNIFCNSLTATTTVTADQVIGGSVDYVVNPNIKNDMNALGELTAANSGGSTAFTSTTLGTTETFCVANTRTGSTATGRGFVGLAANDSVEFGTRAITYTAIHRIPTLSNATDRFAVRSGFIDSNSGAGVDGAHFIYSDTVNGGNWSIVTQSNSIGPAAVDSGVAVSASSYYKLEVVVNAAGTSVEYYIDGVLVHTETSSIPTGSTRRTSAGFGIIKSVGTTQRGVYTDYLEVAMEGSTR